ncbi:8908_t:CDS:1, partial [Acaulospora morrowiae]
FHVIHFYFRDCPWSNIIVEVAYSESMAHVKEKVKGYWLKHNRAYDEIVVKINPVSQ